MTTQRELMDGWREFFDTHLISIGMRAPMPRADQSSNDYARETCRTLKRRFLPQNHELYGVQFRGLDADVLERLAPQLVEAVRTEAVNPANLRPDELRPIERLDPQTGRVMYRDWIGQESFVKAMGRPGRRVVRFLAPVDSHGRALRQIA